MHLVRALEASIFVGLCLRSTTHRLLLYNRVFALITLLANTIQNPTHTLAHSDLQVAETCMSLLSSLKESATSKELENMQTSCVELYNSAKSAISESKNKGIEFNENT